MKQIGTYGGIPVVTYEYLAPVLTWENLTYDVARAFDGQMKNIDRLWDMILNRWL